MAIITKIQGESIAPFTDNLSGFANLEAYQTEVFDSNYTSILKWRWPKTDGYREFTIDGDNYTFEITSTDTLTMLGRYDIETTIVDNGFTIKDQSEKVGTEENYILIKKEAV